MIGAGMEFEVNDRATFGVEYKFSDFGPGFHPANAACGPCSTSDDRNISVSAHTVSARINVRF
jgi:opacity protein-like surface antigen